MITVIPLPVKSKEASSHAEEFFAVRKKDAFGDVHESADRFGPDRLGPDRVGSSGGTIPGRDEEGGFAAALGRAVAKTDSQRGTGNGGIENAEDTGSGRRGRTEAETVRAKFGRIYKRASGQVGIRPTAIRDTKKTAGEYTAGVVEKNKNALSRGGKTDRTSAGRADRKGGARVRKALSHRFVRLSDTAGHKAKKKTVVTSGTQKEAKAGKKHAARNALKERIVVKGMREQSRNGFKVDEREMGKEESRPKPHAVKEFGKAHAIACERYETNLSRSEISAGVRTFASAGRSADEVFGDIVRQFSFMVKKGGGEARIVLKPESLGELKLNIRLSNSQVNTHMVVETTALRDMIVSRLSSLQDSLMSQGFSLGSFDVEVKDQNASNETGEKKSSGQSGAVRRLAWGEEPEDTEEARRATLPWISTVVNITV
ncbi:MAG: flagellar hook-length control protein FliK [Spirochaetes bacterium]|nr:flagellar hook-length control protein FliK [Spirochaetota bacterium]